MATGGQSQAMQLIVLLFSMAGPLKMIPVFYGATARVPRDQQVKLAFRTALLGVLGFALAVFVGSGMMKSWGVSHEALGTGAGLVLLLSAIGPMLGSDGGHGGGAAADGGPSAVSLAFPAMLAPNAMGLIILFAAYLPDQGYLIVGLGAALMAINAICMIFAQRLFNLIGMATLQVLGAIFGILQLSLGVEMIFWGVKGGLL